MPAMPRNSSASTPSTNRYSEAICADIASFLRGVPPLPAHARQTKSAPARRELNTTYVRVADYAAEWADQQTSWVIPLRQ
jgi:hypothetical protein